MAQGLVDGLRQRGMSVFMVTGGAAEDWSSVNGLSGTLVLDRSARTKVGRFVRSLRQLSSFRSFYLLGADVLDGRYGGDVRRLLLLTWRAALVCDRATIVGFSFNDTPTPQAVHLFKALPKRIAIFSRDPVSQRNLARFTKRESHLSADVAFLLQPRHDVESSRCVAWIRGRNEAGDRVMGVNFWVGMGPLFKLGSLASFDAVGALEKELKRVLASDERLSVLLIPHDFRGDDHDFGTLRELYARLVSEFADRILLAAPPLSAAGVKALVSELNCVVSSRMHLAIACLGAGTPVACIEYQGKFSGLYEHFGLPALMITRDEMLEDGKVARLMTSCLDNEERLRATIARGWPRVRALAAKNLG